jgi:hypothetical protein
MSKRSSKKSKRRSKAVVPALGITGLSLSLASGATASTGEAADALTSQPHQLFLGEEEVFDTSLSTFFTFDKENGEQTSHAQDLKLAKGGGCGGGGGGCGGGGCGGGGKGGCGGGGGGCACGGGGKGGYACGGGGVAAGVRGPTGAMGVRGPTGAMGVRGWGCKNFHVHCRCAFFRRCFGCGCSSCGGCWGCGTCWIWTPTWGWINTCWSESTPAGEETRVASEQIEQTAIAEEKK